MKKFYVIAGEKSGDMHAAKLIFALREIYPDAVFRGIGGDLMAEQGAELVLHIRQTAFMGLTEVIKNLPRIKKNFKICRKDLLDFAPDLLILVDYPGFNLKMADFAKKNGLKTAWFISPKLWAWNTGRVEKIKKYVDLMLCILPFEQDFYQKFGYTKTAYIGNPILDTTEKFAPDIHFSEKNQIKRKVIALLPGSRQQELRHNLAVMTAAAQHFSDEYEVLVAGISALPVALYESAKKAGFKIIDDQTYDILSVAHAAIVVSGTATLETAIFNVPQVVVYRMNFFTALFAWLVVKIPFVSLANLVAEKGAVKELLQYDCSEKKLKAELLKILSGEVRENILADYAQLHIKLGKSGASFRAADAIKNLLEQ
jgi:lipid-A-disaccharide synthase